MKSFGRVLILLGCALVLVPTMAAAQQAVLYELTENAQLTESGGVHGRHAYAALQGWAEMGTPVCPSESLVTNSGRYRCTVTAVGIDDVSLATGKGTISGTWSTVVKFDNDVDAPEGTALTGTFSGEIDLTLAITKVAPLGFVTNGVLTVDGTDLTYGFSGTFRLPFSLENGRPGRVNSRYAAYYLGDDGAPIRVRGNERALGWPLVRLEVNFH